MNKIKQFAGQTAIYGASTIVARLLNYLLVPLYTYKFAPDSYGIVSEMYAYVAFIIVLLTYGMETAFFRYNTIEVNKEKVYSTTLISIVSTSVIFLLGINYFSQSIANVMHYPNNNEYVIWFGLIVAFDAITSIPFALLRSQNKAKKFAVIKLINIGLNLGLNIFFILLCPLFLSYDIGTSFIHLFFDEIGVKYIFISNVISSAITVVLLWKELKLIRLGFDKMLWQKLFLYAFPLLFFGLAGVVNETLDRILLKYLLPSNIAMHELGIYSACYKVAIILTIFVQAYKYAAEPFFFAQAKEKNSGTLYAHLMTYFVIIMSFILLFTMMYLDDIIIHFIGPQYHKGAPVILILLVANLFLGIFYNLSIWYKLTDKTIYGAYLSVFGALVTIVLNILWIPVFGYMGSAWATLICYFLMMLISYIIGQKYYPISYQIKKMIGYMGLAIALVVLSRYVFVLTQSSVRLAMNTFFIFFYVVVVYRLEKASFLTFIKPQELDKGGGINQL